MSKVLTFFDEKIRLPGMGLTVGESARLVLDAVGASDHRLGPCSSFPAQEPRADCPKPSGSGLF